MILADQLISCGGGYIFRDNVYPLSAGTTNWVMTGQSLVNYYYHSHCKDPKKPTKAEALKIFETAENDGVNMNALVADDKARKMVLASAYYPAKK